MSGRTRKILHLDLDAFFQQAEVELAQQDVENAVEMLLVELVEDHDIVDAVQEFWQATD